MMLMEMISTPYWPQIWGGGFNGEKTIDFTSESDDNMFVYYPA
jgi:hypothetical protein